MTEVDRSLKSSISLASVEWSGLPTETGLNDSNASAVNSLLFSKKIGCRIRIADHRESIKRLIKYINKFLISVKFFQVESFDAHEYLWKVKYITSNAVLEDVFDSDEEGDDLSIKKTARPGKYDFYLSFRKDDRQEHVINKGKNSFNRYELVLALFSPFATINAIERRNSNDLRDDEKEIKLFFEDKMILQLERIVRRMELPKFPEGCCGKAFASVYQLNKELSSGAFGIVYLTTHRNTGEIVAVKAISRKNNSLAADVNVFREVSNMSFLKDHENIVHLIDFFIEPDWYLIVMEYISGGSLFDRLAQMEVYNENDARDIIKELLIGIHHCHEQNVAHLDLKSRNLLLKSEDDNTSLKIADFGLSEIVTSPRSLMKQKGTLYFVAPEVLVGEGYDQSADMWSVGVLIFLLLTGRLPFKQPKPAKLFMEIIRAKYIFPEEIIVSNKAKKLLENLLVRDQSKRWTALEALNSDWFEMDKDNLSRNDLTDSAKALKFFDSKLKLRAAILAVDITLCMKLKHTYADMSELTFDQVRETENEDSDESDL